MLSGQKLIKNAKEWSIKKVKLAVKKCYQTGQIDWTQTDG